MTDVPVTGNQRNPNTGLYDSAYDSSLYYPVNGSGFGSKAGEFTFSQNFEGVALNADVQAGSNAGGTGLILREGGGHSIQTAMKHSGTRSWRKNYTGSQYPKLGVDFPVPARKAYMSSWFRYHLTTSTGSNPDWKLGRMGNRLGDPYNPNRFDHEYTGNPLPNSYTMNVGITNGGATSTPYYAGIMKGGAGRFFPLPDTWYFYQIYGDSGDYRTNNCRFQVFINGIDQGYFDGTETNNPDLAFRNVDYPDMLRGVIGPICGYANPSVVDVDFWKDEFYVTTGWQHSLITNTPVWTNYTSGKIAQLFDYYWRDSQILFDKSQRGVFSQGESCYRHTFDNNGNVILTEPFVVP